MPNNNYEDLIKELSEISESMNALKELEDSVLQSFQTIKKLSNIAKDIDKDSDLLNHLNKSQAEYLMKVFNFSANEIISLSKIQEMIKQALKEHSDRLKNIEKQFKSLEDDQ